MNLNANDKKWVEEFNKVGFEIIGLFSQLGDVRDLFLAAILFVEKDDHECYRGPKKAHKSLRQRNAFGFRACDRIADGQKKKVAE